MSVFDDIGNKVNELSSSAVEKSRIASEVMNLKSSISEEEKKIKNIYSQIGEIYYTKKGDAQNELEQLCLDVDECHHKIAHYKKQILIVKKVVECPTCGHENPETAAFCLKCGTKLIATIDDGKHCRNCGAPLTEDQLFCTRCGTKVELHEEEPIEEESIQEFSEETSDQQVIEETEEQSIEEAINEDVEEMILCPKCGKEMKPGQTFCTSCGTNIKEFENSTNKEQPVEERKVTKCPKCGKIVKPGYTFCTECGTHINEYKVEEDKKEEKVCPNCHTPIKEGQKFCVVCGERLDVVKKVSPKKVCPNCGLEIEGEKDKCDICGAYLDGRTVNQTPRCPKCGKEVKHGQLFCTGCGTKLQ